MKLNKILFALALAGTLAVTGCRDQFAELNQDPSSVTTPEPSYLMAECIRNFDTSGYLLWFYNASYYARWSQMVASGAYSEGSNGMGATGDQGSTSITMLRYRNDILNYIDANDALEYSAYSAVCTVLGVYCGIFDSDIMGYIPYTEAALYRYGGTLTPAYDSVESLYTLWIEELDSCIANFTDKSQIFKTGEDVIYGGDLDKWAKLANTLKLKIAVRLYNNDPATAKSIAESVAKASVGYIDDISDDFILNKANAVTSGDGDYVYHFGNGTWQESQMQASQNVIDFMMACKDPRVRFTYTKNGFNSKVVQGFIDAGQYDNLPSFVKDNIALDADGNFASWTGMGEPWVRYTGYPVVLKDSPEYEALKDEYFVTGTRYNIQNSEGTKSYSVVSVSNEEMVRGRVDFTLPTLPGTVIQDTDDNPWFGLFLGAGEANLYLAEFSLLGASLPKDAETYYKRGVQLSVEEYDYLANANKIPYYGDAWIAAHSYAADEASIELRAGEIDAMLATDAVKLSGSTADKLEKVYLQQLMHFAMQPDDQFVTARRSGYPKIGSKLLPFVKFDGLALEAIPRRFEISAPGQTDLMYDIKIAAYQAQGFTTGTGQSGTGFTTTTVLNTERLWQDKNAPQWGSPK